MVLTEKQMGFTGKSVRAPLEFPNACLIKNSVISQTVTFQIKPVKFGEISAE